MNWNAFRFHDPVWLLLLIAVAVGWTVAKKIQLRSTLLYSSVTTLKKLPVTFRQRMKRLLPVLRFVTLTLVVLALARPQLGREEYRVQAEGIAIEMCIDKSGSMDAMDFELNGERVNRLEIVKDVFRKFVIGEDGLSGRENDQIGLIAFGGFADALVPQTLDHGALLEILKAVEIPQPIRDGNGRILNRELWQQEQSTAIGDAITLAVDRLREVDAKSKVVILLSDGENSAGVIEPLEAAEVAKSFGIRVYTIGVGTTGMAPYMDRDFMGRAILNRTRVTLDEETLTEIANITDGEYFNAQSTEALESVYERIDTLEKTKTEGVLFEEYTELFPWLIVCAAGLLVFEILLASTWLRSLPV